MPRPPGLPPMRAKREEAAHRSHQDCSSQSAQYEQLQCAENLHLFYFLRQIKDAMIEDGEGDDCTFIRTVRRAAYGVRDNPVRICDVPTLTAVKGIGPTLIKIVVESLFALYPPAPPSEEEIQLEASQKAAAALKAKAEKDRAKEEKAAEKRRAAADAARLAAAGSGPGVRAYMRASNDSGASPDSMAGPSSGGAWGGVGRGRGGGGGSRGRGRGRSRGSSSAPSSTAAGGSNTGWDPGSEGGTENAAPTGEAEAELAPKKRKAAAKAYCPQLGTANYAFLIMLYRAHMEGAPFLTKADLMSQADRSGLSTRSIYGNHPGTGGQFTYNGWSSVGRMENNEPPLMHCYSSPKKVKLTAQGFELARKVHDDAVLRGSIGSLDPDLATPAGFPPPSAPDAVAPTCAPAPAPCRAPTSAAKAPVPGQATARPPSCVSHSVGAGRCPKSFQQDSMEMFPEIISISDSEDDEPPAKVPAEVVAGSQSGARRQQVPQPRPAADRPPPVPVRPSATSGGTASSRGLPAGGAPGPARPAFSGRDACGAPASSSVHCGPTTSGGSFARQESSQGLSRTRTYTRGTWWLPTLADTGSTAPAPPALRLPPLRPGACFGDDYDLVLLIDNKEQFAHHGGGIVGRTEGLSYHVDQLRARGVSTEVAHLNVGDALWIARSKSQPAQEFVLEYLVERKRVDDLASSIKDGRFLKQKAAMRRCGCRCLLYLVEGLPETLPSASDQQAVKTACVITEIFDGFEVLHTTNTAATVQFFMQLTTQIQAQYSPMVAEAGGGGEVPPTLAVFSVRATQDKRITVRDVWGLMLNSVKGVGPEVVVALLEVYPVPRSLAAAYQATMATAVQEGRHAGLAAGQMLAKIEWKRGGHIGEIKSRAIFEKLFESGWHI